MSKLERDLEESFRTQVRKAGGLAVKMMPVEAGMPDRLVLFPGGRAFLAELKTDTGVVSDIQKARHEKIARYGFHVHVIYGEGGIRDFIRSILASLDPGSRMTAHANRGVR